MWPAATLKDVFQRARAVTDSGDPLGERLVSMVFAPPTAPLWKELEYSVGYLDAQTVNAWDLFFMGIPAVARADAPKGGTDWSRFFLPDKFTEVSHEVTMEHREALISSGRSPDFTWRHSGGSDLVSLMAYRGKPDWLSLTAARMDGRGDIEAVTLAEVAARQTPWQEGVIDPELSPGQSPRGRGAGLSELKGALAATAVTLGALEAPRATAVTLGALGTDVAGNAAYELIKSMIGVR